ncbi:hypothetical protein EI74_0779 [Mycoplasma testudineum]|uniref:PDxFFG protein n=1 Tax=Mycoplasma testudineum TaxID=244584 RepID=A0A4R6IAB6_9MOLU|nr:PDxFFG protein [Mycoplasma testudineum]TDO19130.1 hypothetical protein EI74_0779 [Mycoplasma testudineum]
MKKIPTWGKYLVAAAALSAGVGAIVGGVAIYNAVNQKYPNNSDAKTNASPDVINYSQTELANYFVDPINELPVAIMNKAGTEVKLVESNFDILSKYEDVSVSTMSYAEFNSHYIKTYNNETPIQIVKIGPLFFKNYYTEVIAPTEFYDYVEWFKNDVAWGPDVITMNSFSILKNVVLNGNNITLGAHSNANKENAQIVFYPDSFFGSLPLYSTIGGQSNAGDKLLQQLNKNFMNTDELNSYLKNVNLMNALANLKANADAMDTATFRNIQFLNLFKDLDVYLYLESDGVSGYGIKHLILAGQTQEEATKFFNENYPDLTFDSSKLIKTKLSTISIDSANNGDNIVDSDVVSTSKLNLTFTNDESSFSSKISIGDFAFDKVNTERLFALEKIQDTITSKFVNFRYIANIGQYIGDTIQIYEDGSLLRFFDSALSASNVLGTSYSAANLTSFIIKNLTLANKILTVELEATTNSETKKTYTFKADATSQSELDLIDDFSRAIKYIRHINPYTIKSEVETRKDNKPYREFSLFNQVYDGLIDKVQRQYPHLLKSFEGEHLVKKINDQGEMEFSIETGSYKGLATSDRISFLYLLQATDPNFKGVGAEFLKYVGAHEYGHHTTLQNIKDVAETENAVLGGISTRAGMSYESFYNRDVFNLYLKARTSKIDFKLENITRDGSGAFPAFSWIDNNGNEVVEDTKMVFGSEDDSDIFTTLSNKQRRFLQDFEGLQEAANLRGLKLSDLFLLNAIDFHSGTLNPSISGKAKYFTYDENGKPKFVLASVENAKSFLKDGQGNPIQFDEENSPIIVTVKKDEEGNNTDVIESINIFNKDGSPIISTPVGQSLSAADLEIISQVHSTINRLVEIDYSNNGWNTSSTFLIDQPTIALTSEDPAGIYQKATKDYFVKYFSDNPDIENTYTGWIRTQSSTENVAALRADRNYDFRKAPHTAVIWNDLELEGFSKLVVDIGLQLAVHDTTGNLYYWTNYNSVLNFVNGGQLASVNGIRNAQIANYSSIDSYFANPNTVNGKIYYDQRDLIKELLNGIIPMPFVNILNRNTMFFESRSTTGVPGSTMPIILKGATNRYTSIDINKGALNSETNGTTLAVFDSFTNSSFSNLRDAIEFLSLDFTKISYDAATSTVNYDIAYVETKFDLTKLLQAYKTNIDKLVTDGIVLETEKNEFLTNIENKQFLANFVMGLYRNSAFNVYVKNAELGENFDFLYNYTNPIFGFKSVENQDITQSGTINGSTIKAAFQKQFDANNITSDYSKKMRIFDYFTFSGALVYADDIFAPASLEKAFINPQILTKPSSDALAYNVDRINTDISQIFTDYVYTIAEALTRDYIQITYAPDKKDLHNLPTYLSGASEANTGFEYFLDPSSTKIWSSSQSKFAGSANNKPNTLSAIEVSNAFSQLSPVKNPDSFKTLNTEWLDLVNSARQVTKDGAAALIPLVQAYDNALKAYTENQANIAALAEIAKAENEQKELQKVIDESITKYTNEKAEVDAKIATLDDGQEKIKLQVDSLNLAAYITLLNTKMSNEILPTEDQNTVSRYNTLKTLKETELAKLSTKSITDALAAIVKISSTADYSNYRSAVQNLFNNVSKQANKLSQLSSFNTDGSNTIIRSSYFGIVNSLNNGFFKDRWQKEVVDWQIYDDNGMSIKDDSLRIKNLQNETVTNRAEATWMYLLRSKGVGDRTITGIYRNKDTDSNVMWGFVTKEQAEKITHLAFENEKDGTVKYLKVNFNNTSNLFYYQEQSNPSSKKTLEDEGYRSWISDYGVFAKYNDALLIPDSSYKIYFVDENKNELKNYLTIGSRTVISENGKTERQSPTKIKLNEKGELIFYLVDQFNL